MHARKLITKAKKVLLTKITFNDIYLWSLKKVSQIKTSSEFLNFTIAAPNVHSDIMDFEINSCDVDFNSNTVFIRDYNTELTSNLKKYSDEILRLNAIIKNLLCCAPVTKIRIIKTQFIGIVRNYRLKLSAALRNITSSEFVISTDTNSVDASEMAIDRKLRVVEELLELTPYDRTYPVHRLLAQPIVKKTVSKTHFSVQQLEKLRDELAEQNELTKYNVIINSIYDRFYPEFYSSVALRNSGKTLLCVLKPDTKKQVPSRPCFYIVGERRDNQKTVHALVFEDSL